MAARELLRRLAARSRSNLYFALVFLPRDTREAFRDVYRFLRAADDLVDSELDDDAKRAGLAAWRATLDAIFTGDAHGAAPPDAEVAARLARAVLRGRLPRAPFDTILDALAEDITRRRFATLDELERWCAAQSGTLGQLCALILGARDADAARLAGALGVALQLANILRDVREDAARGHVYLPADVLARHGATPDDVLAGRARPAIAAACAELIGHTRARFAAPRAELAALPALRERLLVAEVWSDVYLAVLDELAARGADPFGAPIKIPRRKKLRIAARHLAASATDGIPADPRALLGFLRDKARGRLTRLARH